jgi:phosphoenolpyruvate-protein kinase (PTS system EI component)
MSECVLHGLAVSGGVAIGPAFVLAAAGPDPLIEGSEAALLALDRVAAELGRTAARLDAQGRQTDAEIIEANRLMAEDPSLRSEVAELALEQPAAAALRAATDRQAAVLAALDDPLLAGRAADVRELGRRAIRALSGDGGAEPPARPSIVVAPELGPAELVDLRLEEGLVLAVALADGSATSHAAIMARSLGVPMVAALGDDVLAASGGDQLVVDGATGTVVLRPGAPALARFRVAAAEAEAEQARLAAGRDQPCVTASGKRIRLLANASTRAEVITALEHGAEGVGLVRTELAFLDATDWPSEEQHFAVLCPTLEPLHDRIATVRTLDFGADKTPAFLRGDGGRGIALLLEHEEALEAQLAAIVRAGAATSLRIMLPLVEAPEQLLAARRLLRNVTGSQRTPPPLGAMIETPTGARRSHELALLADFISIGTNDLVATTLGLDRDQPGGSPRSAAEPAVVELMRRTVESAHAAGITVEVCGEAAGEPELTALLVGLGVDELSVSPTRLDAIRDAVRRSGEPGDELRELRDRRGGVVA